MKHGFKLLPFAHAPNSVLFSHLVAKSLNESWTKGLVCSLPKKVFYVIPANYSSPFCIHLQQPKPRLPIATWICLSWAGFSHYQPLENHYIQAFGLKTLALPLSILSIPSNRLLHRNTYSLLCHVILPKPFILWHLPAHAPQAGRLFYT